MNLKLQVKYASLFAKISNLKKKACKRKLISDELKKYKNSFSDQIFNLQWKFYLEPSYFATKIVWKLTIEKHVQTEKNPLVVTNYLIAPMIKVLKIKDFYKFYQKKSELYSA